MGGGAGGGSTQIGNPDTGPRTFAGEEPSLNQGYQFQTNQENQYIAQNPMFNTANQGALSNYGGLGGLLSPLMQQYGNYPNIQGQLNSLQSQFGSLGNNLQRQFQNQPGMLMGQENALRQTNANYLNPIIQSGGALNAQQSRDVNQATSAMDANQFGTGANQLANLGNSLLNRSSYEQQRYGTALQQMQGNDQALEGLAGSAQGLGTSLAQARQGLGLGLAGAEQGMRGQALAQQTGLASGIQGLQTGGLNQLIGAGQAGVNAFSQTTNPMLSYLSNMFGENLQAQIAQAQINQQGNIANQNKSGGMASGALGAIGSIAPALAGI